MGRRREILDEERPKHRPAMTEEGRESQLIALAYDEVERRLRNHTATSQETTHFLKLGSQKAKLELERLRKENELLVAMTESLKAQKHSQELFEQAMAAFGIYTGKNGDEEDEDEFVPDPF